MVFSSFDDLVHMGGHGFYVWMAYGAGIACLVTLVALPLAEHGRLLGDIARRARRDAANRDAGLEAGRDAGEDNDSAGDD